VALGEEKGDLEVVLQVLADVRRIDVTRVAIDQAHRAKRAPTAGPYASESVQYRFRNSAMPDALRPLSAMQASAFARASGAPSNR